MNNDLGKYELIQQYLKGKLSGEDLRGFEKRLLEETDFKNYVENHHTANLLIKRKELNSIKNELQQIHFDNLHSGGSWKLISVILVGLVLGFFTWKYFASETNILDNKISKNNELELINKKEDFDIVISSELESKMDQNNMALLGDVNDDKVHVDKENKLGHKSSISEGNKDSIKFDLERINIKSETLIGSRKPSKLTPIVEKKLHELGMSEDGEPVDCESFAVHLDIDVYSSCSGKNDGFIKIKNDEFTSGYHFIVDQSKPKKARIISDLSNGMHEVIVVDEKGCKSDPIFVNVTERICDFIISESQSVLWEIPVEYTLVKDALLEVYDAKSGQLVYSKRLNMSEAHVWNGHDSNDQYLPLGSYIYNISFNGSQATGEIRILN